MIVLFILMRLLFIASMVFIIGYIYGSFSKKRSLTVLARVAAILVIVLFIGSNLFFLRSRGWGPGYAHGKAHCGYYLKDSTGTVQH